jgi:hypothetical protein
MGSPMKALARDRLRPGQRVMPALIMLIASAAVFSMLSKDGIAADDKHDSADPRLVVPASDSVKLSAIDPHDAEWINALAEPRKRRRHADVNDGRGNVAFLNDDGEVVGLCTAGPSAATSSINDAFLREFLTRFPKVNRMYLRDTPEVTDKGLDPLAKQTGLRKLIIASPKVTDAGVARLTKLNQLESLLIYFDCPFLSPHMNV